MALLSPDCVKCLHCFPNDDVDEKAILIVGSADLDGSDYLVIEEEVTKEFFDAEGDLTYEKYYVVVKNNGAGMEQFTLKARCLIP